MPIRTHTLYTHKLQQCRYQWRSYCCSGSLTLALTVSCGNSCLSVQELQNCKQEQLRCICGGAAGSEGNGTHLRNGHWQGQPRGLSRRN